MSTISVLMCTHNSRRFLPMALKSYLSQDWADRELVVVDDGDDPIEDLVTGIAQYHWFPAKNLAQKRNEGMRRAKGKFVVHFDSDDWSGPGRISDQIQNLGHNKVIGYGKAWWYDTRRKMASYADCGLWGATLMYERQWALDHPWDETRVTCEDAQFLQEAIGRTVEMAGGDNFVALAHEGNAVRPFGASTWPIVVGDMLPEGFRDALGKSSAASLG